ncbi:helix-turn-helix domain-containing protein [Rossellomorea sp. SC111]|uniref:helix-turn-helix domain-containing protein n=1 Tax=Rossellomorea sp. SC111 TaxID=2968985 RepID=UPI00215A15DB|nr:helix-turn-helix domain-containing protein [Rossellomorea sp. SC111]
MVVKGVKVLDKPLTERELYGLYLGILLRKRRDEMGYTQAELEEKAQLARTTISKIERNDRIPESYTLSKIAIALGISVDRLNEEVWENVRIHKDNKSSALKHQYSDLDYRGD